MTAVAPTQAAIATVLSFADIGAAQGGDAGFAAILGGVTPPSPVAAPTVAAGPAKDGGAQEIAGIEAIPEIAPNVNVVAPAAPEPTVALDTLAAPAAAGNDAPVIAENEPVAPAPYIARPLEDVAPIEETALPSLPAVRSAAPATGASKPTKTISTSSETSETDPPAPRRRARARLPVLDALPLPMPMPIVQAQAPAAPDVPQRSTITSSARPATPAKAVATQIGWASTAPAPSADDAEAAPVMAALNALPASMPAPITPPVTTRLPDAPMSATADLLAARTPVVRDTAKPALVAPPVPVTTSAPADIPVQSAAVAAPVVAASAEKPTKRERKAEVANVETPAAPAAADLPAVPTPIAHPVTPRAEHTPAPIAAGATLAAASTDRHVEVARHAAWADGIARDIASIGAANGTARFAVSPETLGTVQVEVKRGADGSADVTLTASSAAAQTALADAKPQLIAEARAQGLHIRDAQIDFGGNTGGQSTDNRHSHAPQPVAVPDQPVTANAPSTISLTDGGYGGGVGGDAGRQAQQQAQGQQTAPQVPARTPQARSQAPSEASARQRADDGRYA